jgi:DNA-binding PadR family transcriptional regulator
MPKGSWLGEFEMYVLLAIGQLNDDAYGMGVRQLIEARTGRQVAIGAVYATLSRLEEKGLVQFLLGEPDPVPGGRARKIFRLTPAGVRELSASTGMLKRMMACRARGARADQAIHSSWTVARLLKVSSRRRRVTWIVT